MEERRRKKRMVVKEKEGRLEKEEDMGKGDVKDGKYFTMMTYHKFKQMFLVEDIACKPRFILCPTFVLIS